jgi:hypothetical protein
MELKHHSHHEVPRRPRNIVGFVEVRQLHSPCCVQGKYLYSAVHATEGLFCHSEDTGAKTALALVVRTTVSNSLVVW